MVGNFLDVVVVKSIADGNSDLIVEEAGTFELTTLAQSFNSLNRNLHNKISDSQDSENLAHVPGAMLHPPAMRPRPTVSLDAKAFGRDSAVSS